MAQPVGTVVGLGPGGPEYVTEHTLAEIRRATHHFVRTSRHPSASLVADAVSFDDVYAGIARQAALDDLARVLSPEDLREHGLE